MSRPEILSASDVFGTARASLGADFTPAVFVDFGAARVFVESVVGEALNVRAAELRQWLGPVSYVALGTRGGDIELKRVVIGVR